MSTVAPKPVRAPRKSRVVSRRKTALAPALPVSGKGDVALAMFARWDKEHRDPRPVSWEKLQATLEENRMREAPLFSE